MNAAHLFTVAEMLDNTGWDVISPWNGPRQLVTWVAVLLASAEHITPQEAVVRVFTLNVEQLLNCITRRD